VGPPYAPCHSQPGTSVGCRALEWNLSEGRAEKRGMKTSPVGSREKKRRHRSPVRGETSAGATRHSKDRRVGPPHKNTAYMKCAGRHTVAGMWPLPRSTGGDDSVGAGDIDRGGGKGSRAAVVAQHSGHRESGLRSGWVGDGGPGDRGARGVRGVVSGESSTGP